MPVVPSNLQEPRPAENSAPEPEGRERLAINLTDILRIDETVRGIMFKDRLDLTEAINVDASRFDEVAVAFTCPLLQAACICDVIRGRDRRAKVHPTRVYIFRNSWSKLPGTADLVVTTGDKPKLNPEIFAAESVLVAPPKAIARR